jgi:hypothetical protein
LHSSKGENRELKKKEIKNIGRILALLGALVCLIYGILYIISPLSVPFILYHYPIGGALESVIDGVILIILSLVVFASYGAINISLKFKVSWIMILIIAIIAVIFGGGLGALLLILSAIVYLIAEL